MPSTLALQRTRVVTAGADNAFLPPVIGTYLSAATCQVAGGFTNLVYGLKESLAMLYAEGAPQVFARHARYSAAIRAAVRGMGPDVVCLDEREHSASVTAVLLPDEYDADKVRDIILDRFDMSLGAGLSKLAGTMFRIGHLGHFQRPDPGRNPRRSPDGAAARRCSHRPERRERRAGVAAQMTITLADSAVGH